MSVDFSQLTPPDIIETVDFETILQERKDALIALFPSDEQDDITEILQRESEPLTKFLQENAYREMILRARINSAARALLLAYATGNDLDHIGANFNVERLVVKAETERTPAVMETDDAYRERIQQAFDRLSVAGPEAAYQYHCFSADGRVGDVTVVSPHPAYVTITILQNDSENGAASPELLAIIEKAVNAEDVRPIADRVTVQSAQIINYNIEAKLYIGKDPEVATVLQQAQQQILDYTTKQKRLGRSIRQSAIYAALHVEGVKRVELIAPAADVVLTPAQAAYCTNINVTLGGIE